MRAQAKTHSDKCGHLWRWMGWSRLGSHIYWRLGFESTCMHAEWWTMGISHSLGLWFTLIDLQLLGFMWPECGWIHLQPVGSFHQSEESWCWMLFVQSGFCHAWFLEAQPPSKAFPKSVCPRRLTGFSVNKRVVGVKYDASVVSPLIYKAIRGRQIITLPSLGSKTRLSWLSMDLVPGKWNSWQTESTWCCFGVGLRGMSLALGCFQATHKKWRELPVWPWAPVNSPALICLLRAVLDVNKSKIVLTLFS